MIEFDSNTPAWRKFSVAQAVVSLLPYADTPEVKEFLKDVAISATKYDRKSMSRKTRNFEYYPNGLVKGRFRQVAGVLPPYDPEPYSQAKKKIVKVYGENQVTIDTANYLLLGKIPRASRSMFFEDAARKSMEKIGMVVDLFKADRVSAVKILGVDIDKIRPQKSHGSHYHYNSYNMWELEGMIGKVFFDEETRSALWSPMSIPVHPDQRVLDIYSIRLERDNTELTVHPDETFEIASLSISDARPDTYKYNEIEDPYVLALVIVKQYAKCMTDLITDKLERIESIKKRIESDEYAALRKVLHAKKYIRDPKYEAEKAAKRSRRSGKRSEENTDK